MRGLHDGLPRRRTGSQFSHHPPASRVGPRRSGPDPPRSGRRIVPGDPPGRGANAARAPLKRDDRHHAADIRLYEAGSSRPTAPSTMRCGPARASSKQRASIPGPSSPSSSRRAGTGSKSHRACGRACRSSTRGSSTSAPRPSPTCASTAPMPRSAGSPRCRSPTRASSLSARSISSSTSMTTKAR